MTITYAKNTANRENILRHFDHCDAGFMVDLKARVDVASYVQKLLEKATRYEAWQDKNLVGFLAVYHNHDGMTADFISHISVVESLEGQGIASHLLGECLASVAAPSIKLDVHQNNTRAIGFYTGFGFIMQGDAAHSQYKTMIKPMGKV